MAGSEQEHPVWVVLTLSTPQYSTGRVEHLEVLDAAPSWDLKAEGQVCYQASVNGGDSVRWEQEREPYVKPSPAREREVIGAAELMLRVADFDDPDEMAGFLWALRGGHRAVGGGHAAWSVGDGMYAWAEHPG